MIQKIRKKSEVLHKHGKHKSVLMEVRAQQHKPGRKPKMYPTVQEALRAKD